MALLLGASLLSVILWYTPYARVVAYPMHLFVVFIHEGCHALAALATGGQVTGICIFPDTSGVTGIVGGWLWLTYSAGYVGTALVGALLVLISSRRGTARPALYVTSGLILVLTLAFIRPWASPFGFVAGLILSGVLGLLASYASPGGASFWLSFLAVQCCFNALYDLRTLLYITANAHLQNDAAFMAQHYPFPAAFWALLWAVIALLVLVGTLRAYWKLSGRPRPVEKPS